MANNIVVTMAGRGSRFYDAGYKVPKYEIDAFGSSLFNWSMRSLKNFILPNSRIIFVCLAENNSSAFVRAQCKDLDIKNIHIVELDSITDGQATSAYLSRDLWDLDGSLLIYNIDTYLLAESIKPEDIRAESDGWIPCFPASGDHWSFVRLDKQGWADLVVEKNRVSDHASVGLYWFRVSNDYSEAYEVFFANKDNLVKGEKYVAPLYQHFIESRKKISISELPTTSVHVLGTPNELKEFLSKKVEDII
jgi:hypothetical protein